MPQVWVPIADRQVNGEENEKYKFLNEEQRKIGPDICAHLLPVLSPNEHAVRDHHDQSEQNRKPTEWQDVITAQSPCEPCNE